MTEGLHARPPLSRAAKACSVQDMNSFPEAVSLSSRRRSKANARLVAVLSGASLRVLDQAGYLDSFVSVHPTPVKYLVV